MKLTREELADLLEGSPDLDLDSITELDASQVISTVVDHLMDEIDDRAGEPDRAEDRDDGNGTEPDPAMDDAASGNPEITWFEYDEWDFAAHDYRPGYCRVGERRGTEGDGAFYEETLRSNHGLVIETRRRFEQLRPEESRRVFRLDDGPDIDLDEAIAFHADKLAGTGPLPRFYTRRNKIVRDVAVALLLDMSASTNDEIGPATPPTAGATAKRVIDIEKESAVLMVEALGAIGDAYGLYGFSGQGHDSVELHVIKELDAAFDDAARRRLSGIEPVRATRMGPAIRHTTSKLDAYPAKVKILILVSDGQPQDDDYGPDRGVIDYAVHDTKRALLEARRKRIMPFLITVDSDGHEYLGQMCGDIGYEIVADIESLPRRLPRLYRYLAGD